MTRNPGQRPTRRQSTADHAARYEALRARAEEHHISESRNGLVVLLRQGVAAWIEAWSTLAAPSAPSTQAQRRYPLAMPHKVGAEVVHLLATMMLGHIEEVHT